MHEDSTPHVEVPTTECMPSDVHDAGPERPLSPPGQRAEHPMAKSIAVSAQLHPERSRQNVLMAEERRSMVNGEREPE